MFHQFRLLGSIILLVFLASCASTEKQPVIDDTVGGTGKYKYDAWRPHDSDRFEAINDLLDEADALIENQAFNAASDKLERALRIIPEYAPAWSRLSWLALQMDSPERAIQMAKRSNSFAYSDPGLQFLNWSFIREASQQLNDDAGYQRANQKMESLRAL